MKRPGGGYYPQEGVRGSKRLEGSAGGPTWAVDAPRGADPLAPLTGRSERPPRDEEGQQKLGELQRLQRGK